MNDGFTLLETLVAFAILSLVIITGFGILGDSFHGLAKIEAHEDINARAENLLNLMVQGLEPTGPDYEGMTIVETALPHLGSTGWVPIRIQIAAKNTALLDTVIVRRTVP